ncbi:MAG TPA: Xaa-Pro peptidase family protein [Candidatus Limnocylindrales bacterium]|nr:Xaa-Pro peptidase family protein [Candidatus Limnocylindrales bacterium]
MSKSIAAPSAVLEIRRWMEARSLAAAYVTNPVSIAYLTGFLANPHERLMALVLRPRDATLIVPAIEREKAEKNAAGVTVVGWRDGEDPYAIVDDLVHGSAEIAVEKEHLTLHSAEVITSRTGASELVDLGRAIRGLRLIKSEAEIEKLARAAELTDRATYEVLTPSSLRPGATELDIATLIQSAIARFGGSLSFPSLVQSGPNSALPHLEPSSRKLAPGDFVLLDFGAAVDGYKADTTRMAVIGKPSDKQREIHQVVLEAHDAAVAAVRPGVTTGDVDTAARRVIEAAGYGPNFFHRIGHGLGLEAHEDPSLDPGSQTVLQAGMVFTIEPGVYVEGFGGVRIEDDVVVTETGCRLLTRSDRALKVI